VRNIYKKHIDLKTVGSVRVVIRFSKVRKELSTRWICIIADYRNGFRLDVIFPIVEYLGALEKAKLRL
jgi:hypothetical protein